VFTHLGNSAKLELTEAIIQKQVVTVIASKEGLESQSVKITLAPPTTP
jgi:hypothetical protein